MIFSRAGPSLHLIGPVLIIYRLSKVWLVFGDETLETIRQRRPQVKTPQIRQRKEILK